MASIWSGFRVMKEIKIKGLKNLPLWLRRAAEARCMAEKSLYGSLKRPVHKAGKVKTGLCWRLQDVGVTRALSHLSRQAADGMRPAKRKKCVAISWWSRLSPLASDMELEYPELALQGFSLAVVQCFLTLSWNGNINSVTECWKSIICLLILHGLQ